MHSPLHAYLVRRLLASQCAGRLGNRLLLAAANYGLSESFVESWWYHGDECPLPATDATKGSR